MYMGMLAKATEACIGLSTQSGASLKCFSRNKRVVDERNWIPGAESRSSEQNEAKRGKTRRS